MSSDFVKRKTDALACVHAGRQNEKLRLSNCSTVCCFTCGAMPALKYKKASSSAISQKFKYAYEGRFIVNVLEEIRKKNHNIV